MILPTILALLLAQNPERPVKLADGGFCAGIAWVDVGLDGDVIAEWGPDFTVYRYRGPSERWGVYSGMFAQTGNGRERLFERDGVQVDRISQNGQFAGYVAEDRGHRQNHFFGPVFKGNLGDLAFFRRVDFGASGKQKCERHPVQ
ncbi:hypothetical protein [Sphingomonas kyeonggiensis]|uniref:Uncharacterized protein n=1 Tax=Sphingomonas kyeonggiensis TaxID=1268553 RepID=A0A7W6JNN6_9SPHN|nr:hypothetical protein [Sphingomonas kyeonggiensis]MBB4096628.1 hypothetical protein [Sphingomonas kyeonggiensis]